MSDIFTAQLTAVANLVLAVFAIVTAVLAGLAFRKQSNEVADQAEMLDLQRRQLAEQERTSAKQVLVLELQAAELRESLEERKREVEGIRRAQASRVFLILNPTPQNMASVGQQFVQFTAEVVNSSDQPAYAAYIAWPAGASIRYALTPSEGLGDILPSTRIKTRREYLHDWDRRDLSDLAFYFTDAAGVRWVRRPNGFLGEVQVAAPEQPGKKHSQETASAEGDPGHQ